MEGENADLISREFSGFALLPIRVSVDAKRRAV